MFNRTEIAVVKGMLARGDKQHNIAAYFNCNAGRVAEIATGKVGGIVLPAAATELPSPAPMKRYFTPGMPLEEQIAIFDSLSKQGPFDTARAHFISPDLAEYILQHNTKNRPKRTGNIDRWSAIMVSDEWGLTGETLIFSKPPVRLLDGQHRLASCVKAGVGFKAFIVFGIDRGEFTKINTGAVKTNADALAYLGVQDPACLAAAIRWMHLIMTDPHDRCTLQNEFVVSEYKKLDKTELGATLKDLCTTARRITKANRSNGGSPYTPGQLAGVLFVLHVADDKATTKFIQALENNKGNAKVLTTRLEKIREYGRINDVGRAGMIVKAWAATRNGEAITAKGVSYDPMTDDFPEIVADAGGGLAFNMSNKK